jgi:hypothetical protein
MRVKEGKKEGRKELYYINSEMELITMFQTGELC